MQVGRIVFDNQVVVKTNIAIIYSPKPSRQELEQGLELLLESFGATLTRTDDLVPCFDVDEMLRRNQVVKGS